MTLFDFDLFVIGAGSGGVRAARMAAATGARVAVAESARLGGTCVNLGCVPKKLMVYASAFSTAAEDAAGFGWTVPEPTFDWATLIANKDREIERLNGIYRDLLEGAGVRIIEGWARLLDRNTVEIDGDTFTAEKILIATGGRPFKSDIPGHELSITSDEIFHLDRQPERIAIAGGGYIAVEFAGILNGMGSDVTLVYRGPLFLRGFDDDVRATLADEMKKRGIRLCFDTLIERIETTGNGLRATTNHGEVIEVDQVLSAMGVCPTPLTSDSRLSGSNSAPGCNHRRSRTSNRAFPASFPSATVSTASRSRRSRWPKAWPLWRPNSKTIRPLSTTPTSLPRSSASRAIGTVGLTEAEARSGGFDVEIFRSTRSGRWCTPSRAATRRR